MAFRDNSIFLMKNMEASHMRACQGKLLLFERLRLFTDLSAGLTRSPCTALPRCWMEMKQLAKC